ncbi:similar to Saccharomyces cerevisiae YHR071W PCL5 Cyclin, interacts with and phosphorylated by Pho85p cyclin-dependent kinase (Cdk) [Geotrichum candidum]|uniref:Similar to Saccharomyces cerevisiae YHR071W PCL5 Cyclin, interacts with and phosphorylated by Pho85p cyclin-dependent kinase (Cdk) n=1 Tax=Geotrichum candidum TaxID=1173061 RepID=A0A0J9XBV3_GEOCN|nr:similar to Saccharomyces cerevisiae YHR071W PCL5 Cyclin, interacts with and phosphorylated by Pho85p cyclin-dependent kinase (Cdk) [Geotrichum candidum]
MSSPTNTELGSVQSSIFSDESQTSSPASSIESSPHNKSKICCSSHDKLKPECKSLFVEALVDSAAIIIETVWPSSTDSQCYIRQVLSLKTFVQETLRRSRTSYSTLQLALYYIIRIKSYIYDQRAYNRRIGNVVKKGDKLRLRCGRRAFLSALMIASKYVQDRNYSIRAWSKISGLPVDELCENEQIFLSAMNWNAHVQYNIYERWSSVLFECACDYSATKQSTWETRFRELNPLVTGIESWQSTVPPIICRLNDKPPADDEKSFKRKASDDPEPSVLNKKRRDSTNTRVREWTQCVATHLQSDSMSAPM